MNRMAKYLIPLLLTLAALAPTCASAAPFGPAEEAAYAQAQAYWQSEPAGCSSLTREVVAAGSLVGAEGQELVGEATIPPPDVVEPCILRVVAGLTPLALCATMTHEDGHLHGLDDSTDPTAMMYPEPLQNPFASPICAAAYRAERRVIGLHQLQEECREAAGIWRTRCWRKARRQRGVLTPG